MLLKIIVMKKITKQQLQLKHTWLVERLKLRSVYLAVNILRRPAGEICQGFNSVNTSLIRSI